MLRSRSRAVSSKNQALMADHSSQSSSSPSNKNQSKPIPSFLCSPRFKAFIFKGILHESDPAIAMSPTSILDTTKPPFSPSFKNQFWHHDPTTNQSPKSPRIFPENKHSWDKLSDSKGIGIVAVMDDKPNPDHDKPCSKVVANGASVSQSSNRMVLFGTKLKVLIPPLSDSPFSPSGSPKNPSTFEIKTQFSASESSSSSNLGKESPRPKVFMSEMEMSEDYTCVISHGPKPKTTHIFDNCIVEENYCSLSSDNYSNNNNNKNISVLLNNNSFLSFCFTCKKNLEQKNDIYIYRGEKAFCSQECRYKEMMLDELEN